jgi:hypothetical protein
VFLAEVSAQGVSEGQAVEGLKKKKGKKKKVNRKMEMLEPQTAQRTRPWSPTAPATLPNEQAVAAFPRIQHILDANRLTWPDVGLHPDCQFARASSTPVNNKNHPGTQSSTREGNAGDGFDLTPQMISFLKRGRKDAMNIPSSNRACDHQEKGWRVINTPYTVLQAYINSALISF